MSDGHQSGFIGLVVSVGVYIGDGCGRSVGVNDKSRVVEVDRLRCSDSSKTDRQFSLLHTYLFLKAHNEN